MRCLFCKNENNFIRIVCISQTWSIINKTIFKMLPPPSPHFSLFYSVADPDPGSGAFLTPGSGIRNRFFPDPGSRISDPGSQTHIFEGFSDNFLGKNFNNSWKIGPNFFLQHIKYKIIFSFVKFVATKNGVTKKNFSPLSFVAVFGSGIRDKHPGSATLLF